MRTKGLWAKIKREIIIWVKNPCTQCGKRFGTNDQCDECADFNVDVEDVLKD